jgi:exonuclease III
MSAGTSILINISLAPLISANGILLEGKAQFITLQIPSNKNLIIINVYAACSSNERTLMWKRLSEVNLATDHFILSGNFNHWEKTESGGVVGKRRMHKREAVAWHHLTFQYGLMDAWKLDSFQKMFAKEFTFDNRRSDARSAILRIDKFLLSQNLDSRGGRIEAATSIRKFSDHSPLVLSIWGQPTIPDKPFQYFDSSLLEDEKGKTKMLQAWERELPKPLSDLEWATWLEAVTKKILACNT